ncbi:MAG TPA: hypothetical protein VGQ46_14125 [Thermoanaerobaculia bacterium]|jgi:hypothetical protein|nr:hypothetical protein [Thermoanaerobaculia bacterium]
MIKRIGVAVALAVAPAVFAQTYIVPDGDCGAITLHATRGSDFPNVGETIGPDRVQSATWRIRRREGRLPIGTRTEWR